MLQKEPAKIWKWIEDKIVSSPEKERSSVITTPSGCLKTGTGSLLSKKILFVAMARTLGIPARLNPHDRSMEYMENGRFVPVLARTEKNCTLILKAGETVQWKYFQNWSIAKLEAGKYITRKLEAENFRDQVMKLPLEAGNYRILTSNRLPNGNIFAAEYYFEVQIGEMKRVAGISECKPGRHAGEYLHTGIYSQKRRWKHREGVRTDGRWEAYPGVSGRGERTDGAYLK